MNLSEILTNRETFAKVASGKIPTPDLETGYKCDAAKRWQIFSRVRFEYVRPTCTLRSQSVPCVCPSMTEEERDYGLKEYIKAGLFPDKHAVSAFESAIVSPAPDSLAYHLKRYYADNEVLVPGVKASLFPVSYIIVHDLHHVLLGSDTTQRGEMEIICFESGMIHRSDAPILLLEQMEIFFSDLTDSLNSATLTKAWNSGKNAVALLDNWAWHDDLHLPLTTVREKYAVLPLR